MKCRRKSGSTRENLWGVLPPSPGRSHEQEHFTPNDEVMKTRDSIEAELITDRATFTLAHPATPSPLTRTTDP
jgi:hypothetical protein